MESDKQESFWLGREIVCTQCGHRNVLTGDFPVVVLKRIRTQGIVSIGFACEQCQTRHIVKQDRPIIQAGISPARKRSPRHPS